MWRPFCTLLFAIFEDYQHLEDHRIQNPELMVDWSSGEESLSLNVCHLFRFKNGDALYKELWDADRLPAKEPYVPMNLETADQAVGKRVKVATKEKK